MGTALIHTKLGVGDIEALFKAYAIFFVSYFGFALYTLSNFFSSLFCT